MAVGGSGCLLTFPPPGFLFFPSDELLRFKQRRLHSESSLTVSLESAPRSVPPATSVALRSSSEFNQHQQQKRAVHFPPSHHQPAPALDPSITADLGDAVPVAEEEEMETSVLIKKQLGQFA